MEIKTNNMKKQFKLRFSYCPFYSLVDNWRKFKYRTTKTSNRSFYKLAERNFRNGTTQN
jgi:hypothetical protein